MASGSELTTAELEPGECALIIGEDDGEIVVRVVAAADMVTEGPDMAATLELVRALAKRLRKDPDFQEDVLDWFYDHDDESDKEDESEDED